jgi:hypothetical protein
MAIRNLYSAESWTKIYEAFSQVNFSSFDYDSIKSAIISYLQIYYPENFNDFIESSELVALIESFAYVAEQLSYRLDMLAHENFITTAQRKQSILKLAKIISYKPARNLAGRGIMKISSISTTENVFDSQGSNLSGLTIIWNDPNNANWKEQFFLILNRTLNGEFGQYSALQQVGDVTMQLYTFNTTQNSLSNGVYHFTADNGTETFPMELVPVLLSENGPFEKTPDVNAQLSVIYAEDGLGDGSDYTGLLLYAKQGLLTYIPYTINNPSPNLALTLAPINVNETDVWVTEVDSDGVIQNVWEEVENLIDSNVSFNTIENRKKYEVETLENDAVKLVFGDGDFSDMPVGSFYFWVRQSANATIVIPPSKLVNQPFSFQYTATDGTVQTANLTFGLTATIQNSAPSESIEHIRQAAPSTYYAQNRMVNGQDYNTFMLKDQSILRLVSINRTFAGQPKYIDWNDASGQYQNIKLFGDDLQLGYELSINSISTGSTISSRSIIDEVIEPLLSEPGIINLLNYISATNTDIDDGGNFDTTGIVSLTRRTFIEDNRQFFWQTDELNQHGSTTRGPQLEKTLIQGAIDQHYYGEPVGFATIGNTNYGIIQDPGLHPESTSKLWLNTLPRTIDGVNPFIPGDVGSGLQPTAWQTTFGLAFNRAVKFIGAGVNTKLTATITGRIQLDGSTYEAEVFTIEVAADGLLLYITSNLRGVIGVGEIGTSYKSSNPGAQLDILVEQPTSFTYALAPGDAFIIRLPQIAKATWDALAESNRTFISYADTNALNSPEISKLNLLGRWELIDGTDLRVADSNLTSTDPVDPNARVFDPTLYKAGKRNPNSWIIWVKAELNPITSTITNFTVNYRELKLKAYSPTTNFWYNDQQQIIDNQTKDRVFDIVRVLKSNLRADDRALGLNQNYDVVQAVVDTNGVIQPKYLEIVPSDILKFTDPAKMITDNFLQFENFANAADNSSEFYSYFQLQNDGTPAGAGTTVVPAVSFEPGSFISSWDSNNGCYWGRLLNRINLDFMWQHFTPYNNLIDPSPSNIHDTYILTNGYYTAMQNYIVGLTSIKPVPPTPLDLRNSYASLLDSKMLSDTVVLHSAKLKLLFGAMADPQMRATFKIVKATTATMTNEALATEVLSVINEYFSIKNWDFGDTFYATELFSLIHQRLPTQLATVVLVPVYAVNSFGSLFTITANQDEILQSCAQLSDIQIVSELNATNMKQGLIS